jgi:hypothetical protein
MDSLAGKGDRYRKVDAKKYRESYERIFGHDKTTVLTNPTGISEVPKDTEVQSRDNNHRED